MFNWQGDNMLPPQIIRSKVYCVSRYYLTKYFCGTLLFMTRSFVKVKIQRLQNHLPTFLIPGYLTYCRNSIKHVLHTFIINFVIAISVAFLAPRSVS